MRSCGSIKSYRLSTTFDINELYRDYGFGVIDLSKPVVYDKNRKETLKLMLNTGFTIFFFI